MRRTRFLPSLTVTLLMATFPATLPARAASPGPLPAVPGIGTSSRVEDIGLDTGFQDTQFGHLQRGRALISADFNLDGRNDFYGVPAGLPRFVMGPHILDHALAGSAVAADYDNDGDPDLFIGVGGLEGIGFNYLFKNMWMESGQTKLSFVDVTARAGIAGPVPPKHKNPVPVASYGIAAADYDQDGWIDFFVSVPINDWTRPALMGRNILWHNNHNGTFTDATDRVGLGTTREDTRFSSWIDFNNDGAPDLYENDMKGANHMWENMLVQTGQPSFVDVTAQLSPPGDNLACPFESFDSVVADFNNDGWQDLMVFERWDGGEPPSCPYPDGNAIFINVNGRKFVNVGMTAGMLPFITERGVMGCQVGDINGDGSPDVFIGNGAPMDNGELNGGQYSQLFVSTNVPGGLPTFTSWGNRINFPAPEKPGINYPDYPYRTHAIDFVDVDGDGRPEIAVSEGGPARSPDYDREPDRLFKIEMHPAARWLLVHPVGDGQDVSRDAIGTRVAATVTDGTKTWTVHGTLSGGSCFSAQNGFDVFLGLRGANQVLSLQVIWPDGMVETVASGLGIDRRVLVDRTHMTGPVSTIQAAPSGVYAQLRELLAAHPRSARTDYVAVPLAEIRLFRCG